MALLVDGALISDNGGVGAAVRQEQMEAAQQVGLHLPDLASLGNDGANAPATSEKWMHLRQVAARLSRGNTYEELPDVPEFLAVNRCGRYATGRRATPKLINGSREHVLVALASHADAHPRV